LAAVVAKLESTTVAAEQLAPAPAPVPDPCGAFYRELVEAALLRHGSVQALLLAHADPLEIGAMHRRRNRERQFCSDEPDGADVVDIGALAGTAFPAVRT
jgi:hypothetical protein